MWDLKTWTCLRAITARRTRRISSSDLPENMTPAITSIQPGRAPRNMAFLRNLASWRLATGRWEGEWPEGSLPRKCRYFAQLLGLILYMVGMLRVFGRSRPMWRVSLGLAPRDSTEAT